MSVEVRLPTVLRPFAGGKSSIDSDAATLGDVLADLCERFPPMADQILPGADGDLPRFVNVYVNDEDVRYLDSLATKVGDGDVVSILPAVAGG
ncbi:MAG: MoaD/ThiS family protein [Acidimicrobiia bacterium]